MVQSGDVMKLIELSHFRASPTFVAAEHVIRVEHIQGCNVRVYLTDGTHVNYVSMTCRAIATRVNNALKPTTPRKPKKAPA